MYVPSGPDTTAFGQPVVFTATISVDAIAAKVNKLPMVLTFLGASLLAYTVGSST